MIKLCLCMILSGFLITSFSQDVVTTNPEALLQRYRAAEYTYQQAEKASQQKAGEGLNSRAQKLYREAQRIYEDIQSKIWFDSTSRDSLLFCIYLRQGNIYYKRGMNDSAVQYYKQAEEIDNSYNYLLNEDQRYYSQLRSITLPFGILLKQEGDRLAEKGRHYEAIQKYHHALLQFDSSFTTTDIYQNPAQFYPGLPFTHLAATLSAKADAFTHLRPGEKNIKAITAALNAHQSSLELAKFIANTGNTRENRSLVQIALSGTWKLIMLNKELYELTGQGKYLEDIYKADQQLKLFDLYLYAPIFRDQTKRPVIPSITSVQQLIDRSTAIISYDMLEDVVASFVITRKEVSYETVAFPKDFHIDITNFIRSLASDTAVKHDPAAAKRLYQTFISPLLKKLKGISRLIIIPDYFNMNYVTFEAFQKNNRSYLLEEFSIQYQYSTAFLGNNAAQKDAPFRSYTASYMGSFKNFHYYIDSIYQLKLDTARVVFFTATNESHFQGSTLANLSAAFTHAGCPNVITSLWNSGEQPSAFVTTQLQQYLDEGYNRDKALQLARIDLLRNSDIDPQFKTPANWANMVLIGEYERPYHPTPWLLISIIASVIAAVVWVVTVKSNY